MKKRFRLEELECANCAAKMEEAAGRIEGVTEARVSFMQQSLTLEAADEIFDDVLKKVQKAMRKIEPDVRVVM